MTIATARIYAISGSLRQRSTNSALLRALAEVSPECMAIEICDCIGDLPIFNPDLEGDLTPASVAHFANKVRAADALIIACPEYAHGIPGGLKNALDWLVSRDEIPHKPVMLARASNRSDYAHTALREVLNTMSVALTPKTTISIHLLGKPSPEIAGILDAPDTKACMRRGLVEFTDWIKACRLRTGARE
ncbi:NADPH-dependent FMN reductase [Rhizobium setariae]|uniref:NADPH-dependent FMN reductase n=1 Tax=Rhizobium setariae TaxID=2801340 RepID=UPI0031BAE8F1